MINSKNKGKRGELEVAALLRGFGYDARRGQQFSGGGDSPDVVHSIKGLHIEVKYTEAFNAYKAMEQAEKDCKKGDIPLVFYRKKRKRWMVLVDAEAFMELILEKTEQNLGKNRN